MQWKVVATEALDDGMTRLTVELRANATDVLPERTVWVNIPAGSTAASAFAACVASAKEHLGADVVEANVDAKRATAEALGTKCAQFAGTV